MKSWYGVIEGCDYRVLSLVGSDTKNRAMYDIWTTLQNHVF